MRTIFKDPTTIPSWKKKEMGVPEVGVPEVGVPEVGVSEEGVCCKIVFL